MSDRLFEHAVRDWLDDGSDLTPPAAIDAVLLAVKTTPQERDLAIPRRFSLMNTSMKLAAGIAIVAIVAGGLYLIGPRLGVGGPTPVPTPAPTATALATSAAPTSASMLIDRTAQAGYTMTVPAGWNYNVTIGSGVFFSPPPPITVAIMFEGAFDRGSSPPEYVIVEGEVVGNSVVRGATTAELLQSADGFYTRTYGAAATNQHPTTIDGEAALVNEHRTAGPDLLWLDAIVIHGDRAYNFTAKAPPVAEAELRAAFEQVLASIRWTT